MKIQIHELHGREPHEDYAEYQEYEDKRILFQHCNHIVANVVCDVPEHSELKIRTHGLFSEEIDRKNWHYKEPKDQAQDISSRLIIKDDREYHNKVQQEEQGLRNILNPNTRSSMKWRAGSPSYLPSINSFTNLTKKPYSANHPINGTKTRRTYRSRLGLLNGYLKASEKPIVSIPSPKNN